MFVTKLSVFFCLALVVNGYRFSPGVIGSENQDDVRRTEEIARSTSVLVVTSSSVRVQAMITERFNTISLPTCHVWDNDNIDFDFDATSKRMVLLARSETTGDAKLHLIDFAKPKDEHNVGLSYGMNATSINGDFVTDRVRFADDLKMESELNVYTWHSKRVYGVDKPLDISQVFCLTPTEDLRQESAEKVMNLQPLWAHNNNEHVGTMYCHEESLIVSHQQIKDLRSVHDIAGGPNEHLSVAKSYSVGSTAIKRYLVNSSDINTFTEFDSEKLTDVAVAFDASTGKFWAARALSSTSMLIGRIVDSKVVMDPKPFVVFTPSWSTIDDIVRLSVENDVACVSFKQGKGEMDAVGVVKLDETEEDRLLASTFEVDDLIGAVCLPKSLADELNKFAVDGPAKDMQEQRAMKTYWLLFFFGIAMALVGIFIVCTAIYIMCLRRTHPYHFKRVVFQHKRNEGYSDVDSMNHDDDEDERLLLHTDEEKGRRQPENQEQPLILA